MNITHIILTQGVKKQKTPGKHVVTQPAGSFLFQPTS